MKKILILLMSVAAVVGCKTNRDDNPHIDTAAAKAPVVSPTQQNVITLNKYAPGSQVTFTWEAANYNYDAAVKYAVEIDNGDGTFLKPIELGTVNENRLTVTSSVLNDIVVNALKMEPDSMQMVKIRVASFISEKIERIYSPIAEYYVRTYQSKVIYPSLGVPGSYQGWAPDNQLTRVWSIGFNTDYEGWLNMVTSDELKFKFTIGNAWGDGGKDNFGGSVSSVDPVTGEVAGDIDPAGGSDVAGVPQGYYKMNVDWNTYKFTLTPINKWGIVGNATPADWNEKNSVAMTYDNAQSIWVIEEVTLTDGEFKFVANDAWGINFGKSKAGDGMLAPGGDNIPATAGKYRIEMNLTTAIPTYQVIPQ